MFFGVTSLDNEESKYSYNQTKDMEMLGGSPNRKKNLADDRRKSSLNIGGMKSKVVDNNNTMKKNIAKR